jgi:beta-galactosidase/beta-glucuronidase
MFAPSALLYHHGFESNIKQMAKLTTVYGESLDKNAPLPEHPNPYFQRNAFISLNGPWDFVLDRSPKIPQSYPDKIIVPFSVETSLSGIEKMVSASQYMHYRKLVEIPSAFIGKNGLLHFDAVDQTADVYIDGSLAASHDGGYFPFSVFLPRLGKEVLIEVIAHDDTKSGLFPRGKQSLQPGGIWYRPTSGIWQSVYLEAVPADGFVSSLDVAPDFDAQSVKFHIGISGLRTYPSVSVYFGSRLVAKKDIDDKGDAILDLRYDFYPWTADAPNLYSAIIVNGGDEVRTVFGLRKVYVAGEGDHHFLMVNGKPTFLSALLDQGYWPESGLTPPSSEAIANDINIAKKAGYNCLRKHLKIEPMRWYYLCDRLGMYVSQDFVNGGSPYSQFLLNVRPFVSFPLSDRNNPILGRATEISKKRFLGEMKETVSLLKGVSSILIWTIFNEGWGQFDAKKVTATLRNLDGTRLIDSTSGWFDKNTGDFASYHVYFKSPRIWNDGIRLLSLSEFGGYSLPIVGHVFSSRSMGYRTFYTFRSYNEAVLGLYRTQIERLIKKQDLSVCVYTQLSDIEEEVNGIVTFDRKIIKLDVDAMRAENAKLYDLYAKRYQEICGPHAKKAKK